MEENLIVYNLVGEVVQKSVVDFTQEAQYVDQKVKIELYDKSIKEGFIIGYVGDGDWSQLQIFIYAHLNEKTHKLVGGDNRFDKTYTFIPTNLIKKMEKILYTSPRWGTILTNKFEVIKSAPIDAKIFEMFTKH